MPKRIYAKNKVILAPAISLSRPALYRLFARPDHPRVVPGKGYNIEQWQRYADENVATWNRRDPFKKNGSNGSHSTNPRDKAFIERQNILAEKEQFNLDVQRGRYWLKETARDQIAKVFGIQWRELEKSFVHELPPKLEGMSAGEIAKTLRRKLHEIMEGVRKTLHDTGTGNQ